HYDTAHVARMRNVTRLQNRGLPLDAIRALLEPDLVLGQVLLPGNLISAALRAEPKLFSALLASGVLTAHPDGGLGVRRAPAVLAARTVSGAEVPIRQALSTLADSVVAVLPLAETVLSRIHTEVRAHLPNDRRGGEELLEFTVEVLRLCLIQLIQDRHNFQEV